MCMYVRMYKNKGGQVLMELCTRSLIMCMYVYVYLVFQANEPLSQSHHNISSVTKCVYKIYWSPKKTIKQSIVKTQAYARCLNVNAYAVAKATDTVICHLVSKDLWIPRLHPDIRLAPLVRRLCKCSKTGKMRKEEFITGQKESKES